MSPLFHKTTCRKRRHVPAHSKISLLPSPISDIPSAMNWPHAPAHWLFEPGLYIVTAGTYRNFRI